MFSRFYSERIRSDVDFQFTGLVHRAGALFNEEDFDGDENAIVDFKYSPSPKITWWFDHRKAPCLRRRMRNTIAMAIRARNFLILSSSLVQGFLAQVAEQKFGFDPRPVEELIRWADIIDGAQFKSPEEAVEMAAPAMKLTMAIESTNDPDFLPRLIPYMVGEPLGQVLQEPFVAAVVPPLLERHRKSIDILRQRSECKQGTICPDIADLEPGRVQQIHSLLSASRVGL